jgi:hypothetical protein
MVERAGHWAHEEQPEKVSELLTAFLREHAKPAQHSTDQDAGACKYTPTP